jgi:hypothetical protein
VSDSETYYSTGTAVLIYRDPLDARFHPDVTNDRRVDRGDSWRAARGENEVFYLSRRQILRIEQIVNDCSQEWPSFTLEMLRTLLCSLQGEYRLQRDGEVSLLNPRVIYKTEEKLAVVRRIFEPLRSHTVDVLARMRMCRKSRRDSTYYRHFRYPSL